MGSIQEVKIVVYDGGKSNEQVGRVKKKKENDIKDSTLYKVLNFDKVAKEWVSNKLELTDGQKQGISMASGLVKSTVKQSINYWISDIGRSNGDSNYQAQINREIEVWTDRTSILTSTLSGASAGVVGGPIGAIVGGAIGLASSLISLGFKKAERERDYAHEMFKQNNSQSYNLSRANYSWQTGRQR